MSVLQRLAIVATAALACTAGAPVAAAPAGVAFDQISIFYFGGSANAPAPAAAFETLRAAIPPGPLAAVDFPPAGGQSVPGLAGLSRLSQGVLYHESVLGNDMRVDDPATMRATISHRDRNEIVYLDLVAKTYRRVTGDAATAIFDPSTPSKLFAQPTPGPSATPNPNSETIGLSSKTQTLDGVTLDGIATRGSENTATITATRVTGTCPAITTATTTVRYVDPARDEPAARYDFADSAKLMKALPVLTCHFIFGSYASPAPDPNAEHFALYTKTDTQTTLPTLATPILATMLVTRGNVKSLGASDATLFEIPAGFTQAPATPGTPEASPPAAIP